MVYEIIRLTTDKLMRKNLGFRKFVNLTKYTNSAQKSHMLLIEKQGQNVKFVGALTHLAPQIGGKNWGEKGLLYYISKRDVYGSIKSQYLGVFLPAVITTMLEISSYFEPLIQIIKISITLRLRKFLQKLN